jgi:hypothetical protein
MKNSSSGVTEFKGFSISFKYQNHESSAFHGFFLKVSWFQYSKIKSKPLKKVTPIVFLCYPQCFFDPEL